MKRAALLLATASLILSACAHTSAASGGWRSIETVEAAYLDAKAFAALLLPFLPAERVVQIAAIEQRIETAIAVARSARSLRERRQAIEDAQAIIAELAS